MALSHDQVRPISSWTAGCPAPVDALVLGRDGAVRAQYRDRPTVARLKSVADDAEGRSISRRTRSARRKGAGGFNEMRWTRGRPHFSASAAERIRREEREARGLRHGAQVFAQAPRR